jgi:hypothetical protein
MADDRCATARQRWAGGVLAALAGLVLAGCATASDPVSVRVKNDSSSPVTLAVCSSHDCSKRTDPWSLKPGQTGRVNVEVQGGYGPAILLRPDGSIMGCLPFRLAKRPSSAFTVTVSEAVGCGTSGGISAAGGRDWPDPDD